MKIELNDIYHSDSIDFMREMRKQKIVVDAVITDPPYNISRENNFHTLEGRKGIDFGNWDKTFNQIKWLRQLKYIVKDGGSVVIFNDWKNMGDISKTLEKEGFEIKDLIRWVKPNPMPRNTSRRYVTDFEVALWAVKPQEKWTFNKPQEVSYKRPEIGGSVPMGKKRIHPTQKSYDAIKELIEIHTNPGDVVFDPFSGSGQISFVASEMNRLFIGSEINEKYWKASRKRFTDSLVKPPFNHLGNKFRMIQKIMLNLPKEQEKYAIFADVFSGSSVVSANYNFAEKFLMNDKDELLSQLIEYIVSNDIKIILNKINSLAKKYNLIQKDYKEGYNKLKENFNKTKDNMNMLILLVLTGFNHQIRFNAKGEFNIPSGKTPWNNFSQERLVKFSNKFKNKKYKFSSLDFEEFIEKTLSENKSKEIVFYVDPPYLLSNAVYNNGWTKKEEERLVNSLRKINEFGAKFVLSNVIESKGRKNEYLEKLSKEINMNMKIIENISYKNSNYQRKNEGKDVEIILKNF